MSVTRFEAKLQSTVSKLSRFNRLNPLNYVFKPTVKPPNVDPTIPVKLTYRQRFINYVKVIIADYKDVGVHTVEQIKLYPLKTAAYFIVGCTFYGAYKTNPSYLNYHSSLIEASNEMIMIGGSVRNKSSEKYLDNVIKLENLKLLEHKDYLFFSLIKRNNFNEDCDLFEKQCKQLNKPNKWNVFNYPNLFLFNISSIVDIGLFDYWIFLNKRLKDCDVNDDEWKIGENK
jgi:hypothetical protein